MKKLVLINPKTSDISRQKGVLPLALLSISEKLDAEGYAIIILDETLDTITPQILQGSLCFGIGAMIGYQISSALKIAKKLKDLFPDIPIIWGGWHPSIEPEQTINNENVDFVVRSQGEETFYELVKAIERGQDFKDILGLTYKIDGVIFKNLDRPLIDPNNFRQLPYHLIDMKRYINESELGERSITYLSSVGCPHRCGFCAEQLVHGRRWLPLKPERVLSDITYLVDKYNIDSVAMSDSDFFINEQRVREICEGIIKSHIKINWGNVNGRADELVRYKESTWELMRKSGLKTILTGAETNDEDVLRLINKGASVSDTVELARKAEKHGIVIKFSFMIGLPISTDVNVPKKEFIDTISFINDLYEISRNNQFLLFLYTPFPGTPLYDRSLALGYRSPASLEEWGSFLTGLNTQSTPWVDKTTSRRVYQANFYFPFISNVATNIVLNYPKYMQVFLLPAITLLRATMIFRLKYTFFSIPLEYFLIKTGFKIKTALKH